MGAYFEINGLNVGFQTTDGVKQVLDIDSLKISRGEAYGIVGESGSGKTVLARTVLRLLPAPPCIITPSSKIIFDGENLLGCTEKHMREKIRGRRIAMIFQDPMSTLNPVFTVGRQISDVITACKGHDRKKAEAGAAEMLARVKMPDAARVMEKYPHELSGGQRQRVIIAAALSCGAQLLIADEPTRNLDVTIQAGILKIIEDLRKELGITVLYLANNMGLVSVTCDRVSVLRDGAIIESGSAREVISSPQKDYTKTLLRSVPESEGAENTQNPDEIMRVSDLKKYFKVKSGFLGASPKYIRAVDGVNLSIQRGDTLGIVGESGCGKTTLINMLTNLDSPTDGTVEFNGRELTQLTGPEMRAARRSIQVVFQDPFWSLDPRMLIRDIIGEPLKIHLKLDSEAYLKKVEEMLGLVGLPKESAYSFPHEFSGGQRQRIAIARALALEAEFIVLDEPTSSVDVVSQMQILKLLVDLKRKYKLTYVIISHDLSVINFFSTHIAVMYLGKIVEYGKARQIFAGPAHPYTMALMGAVPRLDMDRLDELSVLEGNVPSAIDMPGGCRFHTRCPEATPHCAMAEPELAPLEDGRLAACHWANGRIQDLGR
ncbi:MAG: ABC transporter ATP-binding protein [Oscillospiraceae bacterium]|nr:ABC transporter ATP-binding protein [Oscillospiraceae bacterium]